MRNIQEASAPEARRVPILRYRTMSASCAASSASCGEAHSEWANLRTCGCEPDTRAAIEAVSPRWAARTTCSPGHFASAIGAAPSAQDGDGAQADEHGRADGGDDSDSHGVFPFVRSGGM